MLNKERIKPDYIFESSWEVCNKIGGIYTVLSTRAKTLQHLFKDKIIFIGPDLWENTENPDFTESKTLLKSWKKEAMEKEKLRVRVGRWNIPGRPVVILVDFTPFFDLKGGIYYHMWEKFGVDSIASYGDYDSSCMFAYAAGQVIGSLYRFLKLEDKNVIAHQNEWMLGMTGLYLQDRYPSIGTVFTTHATSIGRSICGNGKPLYREFRQYNGDQMARELNMEAKHSLEKQAARYADCFTTVSGLTARECSQLLEKRPDVITPNGFEAHFVPDDKKMAEKRKSARDRLLSITMRLTGEAIEEDALLVAISGRYEYKNKGIDLFVEALNRIRWANPERQVIGFILVPAWIDGPRTDLRNRLKKEGLPDNPLCNPYYTHQLNHPEEDKVCGYLRHLDFLNQKAFRTKLLFIPCYLNGTDGIVNISYYDLLPGLDLTVFPSYYEPWGYTPLESIAFGIPTITTNLAGFGLWAREEGASGVDLTVGVEVLERTEDNYFEIAEEIKENIIRYSGLNKEENMEVRNAARRLSEKASWEHFIDHYLEAYDIALGKARLRSSAGEKKSKTSLE